MKERNSRTVMLIGEDNFDKLLSAKVAVFGLGGVGGHTVEALVRAGIGEIDLFDNDTVSESNINRQLIATYDTLGEYKTEAFKKRIKSINPDCRVNLHTVFVTPETVENLDLSNYDCIVDAIDTVSGKLAIIKKAYELNIPVISSMGAALRTDTSCIKVSTLDKTQNCGLAKTIRLPFL